MKLKENKKKIFLIKNYLKKSVNIDICPFVCHIPGIIYFELNGDATLIKTLLQITVTS